MAIVVNIVESVVDGYSVAELIDGENLDGTPKVVGYADDGVKTMGSGLSISHSLRFTCHVDSDYENNATLMTRYSVARV
jgi:hypothetical protein